MVNHINTCVYNEIENNINVDNYLPRATTFIDLIKSLYTCNPKRKTKCTIKLPNI